MYSKILVPTDGSEGAEIAVEHALNLAEKFDSELHVMYVADVRVGSTGDMWTNMIGQLEEMGEEATSEIADQAKENGVATVTNVVRGVPHREINEYVEENGIEMIVMGTHGRTGIDRILLGSVTEKIVRTSKIPVMTVGRED